MKILLLSYDFPPSAVACAKRPFIMARYLADAGWNVDVLACTAGTGSRPEVLQDSRIRVLRVKNPLHSWQERLQQRNTRAARACLSAIKHLAWPDVQAAWLPSIRKLARQWGEYDVVLASLGPKSIALLGCLRIPPDCRLVIDYQDSVSPHYRIHPRKSPLHKALHHVLERFERRTLRKCVGAVFTATSNRDACVELGFIPHELTTVVHHFFDPELYCDSTKAHTHFDIIYAGKFYRQQRRAEPFFHALASFLDNRPDARKVTRFRFFGEWDNYDAQWVSRYKLQDVVEMTESQPFTDYLQTIGEASLLLFVTGSEHNLFMPGKLADYLGAGRPILGMVPAQSEAASVLREAGHGDSICDENDWEHAREVLTQHWDAHATGEIASSKEAANNWSVDSQMGKLLNYLKGTVLAPAEAKNSK